MTKLLAAPLVVAVIAAAEVARRSAWLAWPVVTTFARTFSRRTSAETEADPVG